MIIENIATTNGTSIALWEITETRDELLDILGNDPVVINEISQFSSEKRILEYLASRCTLNAMCQKPMRIVYLPSGMPYVDDHSVRISISHTGKYVTVIIHPDTPVGIDIERISDRPIRVKHKFLSDDEIFHIDPRSEKTHLTLLWAVKEALYKVIGIESVDFINDLHIAPFQPYLSGTITARETVTEAKATYNLEYKVFPEFVVVWVKK